MKYSVFCIYSLYTRTEHYQQYLSVTSMFTKYPNLMILYYESLKIKPVLTTLCHIIWYFKSSLFWSYYNIIPKWSLIWNLNTNKGGRRCTIEGCNKGARDKNYCAGHGGGKRCSVEMCNKSAVGGSGHCCVHGGGK